MSNLITFTLFTILTYFTWSSFQDLRSALDNQYAGGTAAMTTSSTVAIRSKAKVRAAIVMG